MNSKECRSCKHYQGIQLPNNKKACLKHKKTKHMFDSCDDFIADGIEKFLKEFRKKVELSK